MKACKHYLARYAGEHVEIVPSSGKAWNGWVVCYEGDREVWRSFVTGLWWRYIEHLVKNEECLREIAFYYGYDPALFRKELEEKLREIEEEWKSVTGDC